MNIGSDVSTDVQVLRLKNSREPIVIETKTTTTTTTVTKRICIAKDANIDIADIQSLLNEDVQTHAVTTPKSNEKATSNFDLLKSSIHQIDSPLSSTKIEDFGENNGKDSTTARKKEKKKNDVNFLSPNLSKIPAEKFFKRTATNIVDHTLKKKKTSNQSKMDTYSTRSKKVTAKPQNDSTGKENYIDGLINQYMTLEDKPRQKNAKKPKATKNESEKDNEKGKQKEPEKVDFLPTVQNDLSAIFENPFEEDDSPMRPVAENSSPIDFDGGCNGYFDDVIVPASCNQPMISTNDIVKESKVSSKTTESSRKTKRKEEPKVKKSSKKNGIKPKASSKKIQAIKAELKTQSNNNQSPIMIYSPSTQKTLTSGDDNKLILTKDMIEKKMKKHSNSSKSMMERFEHFKEMRVDADSRLIFYPESKGGSDSDDSDDSDILKNLRNQSKALLVKEYSC